MKRSETRVWVCPNCGQGNDTAQQCEHCGGAIPCTPAQSANAQDAYALPEGHPWLPIPPAPKKVEGLDPMAEFAARDRVLRSAMHVDTMRLDALRGPEPELAPLAYWDGAVPSPVAETQESAPPTREKRLSGLQKGLLALAGVSCLCMLVFGALALRALLRPKETRAAQTLMEGEARLRELLLAPTVECGLVEGQSAIFYPALYKSMEPYVEFSGIALQAYDVLIRVEIPGFTLPYEKRLTLDAQGKRFRIKPALLPDALDGCKLARDAQLNITVERLDTGEAIVRDTTPLRLQSMYDIRWMDADRMLSTYDDLAAWITPEDPIIRTWLRDAVDIVEEASDGQIDQIAGYQEYPGMSHEDGTLIQLAALFETLGKTYQLRYTNAAATTSGMGANQHINLPAEVIQNRSGLCIETVVTMASPLEAAGFSVLVLVMPTHAQLAVETWPDSGEYIVIETTALTATELDDIFLRMDPSEWTEYLEENDVIVVDLELAREQGIMPMR